MQDQTLESDSNDDVGDIAPREKPKTPAKQLEDDLQEAAGEDAKDDDDGGANEEDEEEEEECVNDHRLCGAVLTSAH